MVAIKIKTKSVESGRLEKDENFKELWTKNIWKNSAGAVRQERERPDYIKKRHAFRQNFSGSTYAIDNIYPILGWLKFKILLRLYIGIHNEGDAYVKDRINKYDYGIW